MDVSLNLAPVFSYTNAVLGPVALGLGAWIIKSASSYLKLKNGSAAADDLDQALQHGENLIVDWFLSMESHNRTIRVPDDVLAQTAQKVLVLAPAAISHLGATPATLAPILQARFTQWLHWQKVSNGAAQLIVSNPNANDQPLPPIPPARSSTTGAA